MISFYDFNLILDVRSATRLVSLVLVTTESALNFLPILLATALLGIRAHFATHKLTTATHHLVLMAALVFNRALEFILATVHLVTLVSTARTLLTFAALVTVSTEELALSRV